MGLFPLTVLVGFVYCFGWLFSLVLLGLLTLVDLLFDVVLVG